MIRAEHVLWVAVALAVVCHGLARWLGRSGPEDMHARHLAWGAHYAELALLAAILLSTWVRC